MAGTRPRNQLLRQARESANLTQERCAEKLTKLADELTSAGRLTRRTSVSVRQYRRWESAVPPWPHADHRVLLETFFHRKIAQLGFTPPWTEDLVPTGAVLLEPGPDEEAEHQDPAKRRHALGGASALGLAAAGHNLPWLTPTASASGHAELKIGGDEVSLLRQAAYDLDAIDQRFGGGRLWRSARAHLYWVHHLIEHGTYTEQVGRELHGISGQLTTSLGWFCYDAEEQAEARVYFSEALNTAMLSGDDPLATRTLSNMARQSVDLGKPREAVRFCRIAEAHAFEWEAPPRVRALLAIREAQGHARGGDELGFENAIKRSWTLFNKGTTDRDPDWTGFLNEAELTCLEGMCRSDLGQHRRAVKLLTTSARMQDIEHSRNRGMCLARLAGAALKSRDFDHTAYAAEESFRLIDGGMTSTRNLKQLGTVRDGLTRLPDPAAKRLSEKLSGYITVPA
ncbi:hypothetical protein [Allonocardiopsis opalescens]|uniref:HTH cro/C1-type domain-containing protein n=1 Tax=Allonocardiopsis opalescens TaxID=1144618 RepID=A0A2T0Q291_9ACTN|nr:hypothetical protein [Allonocardiopsis opalescens]PRX97899.1 hypothetical protein CLV72_105252 [Allonocardiopsis opalescens]